MLFKEDQGVADRLRRAPILALWRRELFDVARADAVELRVAEERKQVDAQHALAALQRRRFPPHALQELEEAFAGLREGHALGGSRTRSAPARACALPVISCGRTSRASARRVGLPPL